MSSPRAWCLSACVVWALAAAPAPNAQGAADTGEFYDSHFHLTNYIQQGISVQQFLQIMGTRVGRSTLFGIPLQQQWSYANSGDFAPTYYLHTDAPLYYYSFTDASIAMAFRALAPEQQTLLKQLYKNQVKARGGFDAIKLTLEDAGAPFSPEQITQIQPLFDGQTDKQQTLAKVLKLLTPAQRTALLAK